MIYTLRVKRGIYNTCALDVFLYLPLVSWFLYEHESKARGDVVMPWHLILRRRETDVLVGKVAREQGGE